MIPARRPMMSAPCQLTFAQPAVMATSPARAPFRLMETSGFLYRYHDKNIELIAPATADILVTKAILPIDPSPTVVLPA